MEFVLVHGAYHGAWCWDLLAPELERRGHAVVAVNLPISEPGLAASEYADAVIAAADGLEAPVVVGHSMAGLVTPIVAERRPVQRLIFLAALLPDPGRSANDQRASEPLDTPIELATAEWTELGDDVWLVGPTTATELFFHDAPADVRAWATARLRAQCYRIFSEQTPLGRWPDVPRASIVCRDDHAANPIWVRQASRERLGVEAIEIDGSHSPFLSRPEELAAILDGIVREN